MAQLNPANTLPTGSADALEIFDERYIMALGVVQPATWVDQYGDAPTTASLTTKYPMSMLALKYTETVAQEGRFKTIGEKMVELSQVEYDDGVEVELLKLIAYAFVAKQWEDAPAPLLQAEQMFKLKSIADMLVANTELCGWDDLALFHDSHLSDPTDANSLTFDNLQASAKDVVNLTNLEAEITAMLEVPDANGDPLGVTPDTVFVPRQKWQGLRNLLKQDFVPTAAGTATMRNPYNESVLNVVRIDQLTDVNDWYLVDSQMILRGLPPWAIVKLMMQAPGFDSLSLRRFDENSDYFKKHGKIAVSSHIYYGRKPMFPHAIRKIAGA